MILFTLFTGLYLLVCAVLFVYQWSLIYFPQPRANRAASVLMSFSYGSDTVNVSTRPRTGPKALIYFGGNAEDVSQSIPDLTSAFPESAIYALHYPGYGGSSGKPSQQTIFTDAAMLFEKVHAEHPDITVVGRSLGSGVAVWLASQKPVTRLVLITPFNTLADAAGKQFPILPVRLLLRDKFESRSYAPLVTAPTRIIVAKDDEIVPSSSSQELFKHFREGVASITVLPDVGHNTVQTSPQYWGLLNE